MSCYHQNEIQQVEKEVTGDDSETHDHLRSLRLDDVALFDSKCEVYEWSNCKHKRKEVWEENGVEPANERANLIPGSTYQYTIHEQPATKQASQ